MNTHGPCLRSGEYTSIWSTECAEKWDEVDAETGRLELMDKGLERYANSYDLHEQRSRGIERADHFLRWEEHNPSCGAG